MALVLTIKKGDDFYIGDDRFVVSEVLSDVAFKIQGLGKEYLITDERRCSYRKLVAMAFLEAINWCYVATRTLRRRACLKIVMISFQLV